MADLFGEIMGEAAAIKGIPMPAPPSNAVKPADPSRTTVKPADPVFCCTCILAITVMAPQNSPPYLTICRASAFRLWL
ncbi:unnamed protein product [Gadus morhua 'NCC']